MKKRIAMLALCLAVSTVTAKAETFIDPLHGFCSTCVAGAQNTPIQQGALLTGFGFDSSPPGLTGTLYLDILVPNNTVLNIPMISGFASGSPTQFTNGYGTAGVTTWSAATGTAAGFGNNPTLTQFLGGQFAGGTPDNNLDNALGATQALDPGATGFLSLLFNAGPAGPLNGQGSTPNDIFDLDRLLPVGSLIYAFLIKSDGSVVNTANSSALFVVPQVSDAPIPGAVWLFGTGVVGMMTLMRRRKRQSPPMISA